jgi:hypothetical protein
VKKVKKVRVKKEKENVKVNAKAKDASNLERRLLLGVGALLVSAVLAGSGLSSATDREPPVEGVAAAAAPENEDSKFGLTLAQRKAVFLELADAERRAESEAEAEVHDPPESMEEVDRAQRLAQKYKAAVAAKYGITNEQAVAVSVEGMESEWDVE